ncbi:Proteinaceous RNase P 1, chloroplastic/mitochondrial [Glycine soja]|uniref:ribonuclease P n=1 Tax=Glycine soja TaxID=3848 RepID=A0A445KSX6_GLYSO|nr:Proteinaceous RNase P 1, chloroplastic/mitochondrial [Glycine soja]
MEATENNGGGRHGQGWLGKGKWEVVHTTIGNDGLCKCCGVQLTTIDLDPVETQNFANLVASLAVMREKGSNFQKFQINAVGNEICQTLPSKKFPLIILHNKRSKGDKMDEPINRSLIDKWNNADALYATPSGSNDNWYWLYAAIKFRCLLVTNDEMRDHLFQLLGNDFFPKWKERHQVRFSFSDTGSPVFHMPPPCSVVIQESDEGHWHIPI